MSNLELKLCEGYDGFYVEFYVDGANLGELIVQAFGDRVVAVDDALPWDGMDFSIADTVLGQDARTKDQTDAILFACGCGCSACSSVSASVHVTESTLTWSNFRTWRQRTEYVANIAPFTFERKQVEDAISRIEMAVSSWKPPERGD